MTAFATAEDLATFLNEEINTAQAEQALDLASEEIRDYCGWRIDRAVETFVADPVAGIALSLPTLKINDVTDVVMDGVALHDFGWSDAGIIWRNYGWSANTRRGISVTVDHGYETPPGIVRIVTLQAASRAVSNPMGMRSIKAGEVGEVYAIPATGQAPVLMLQRVEMHILNRYRIF